VEPQEEQKPQELPLVSIVEQIKPSNSLYLKNLNDKIRRSETKKSLYSLFSLYGPILDLVAKKSQKMRGQAFVVFKYIDSAVNAHTDLQNFDFYGKKMIVEFAKTKSDIIAKMDGSFVPRQKKEMDVEEDNEPKKKKGRSVEKTRISWKEIYSSTKACTT